MGKFAYVKTNGDVARTGTNVKIGFQKWQSGDAESMVGEALDFVYDLTYTPEQMEDKGAATGEIYKVSTAGQSAFEEVISGGSWDVLTETWQVGVSQLTGWARQEYYATLNYEAQSLQWLKQNLNNLAKTIVRKLIYTDAESNDVVFNDPDILPNGFTARLNDRKSKLATFQGLLQSAADAAESFAVYNQFKILVGWKS